MRNVYPYQDPTVTYDDPKPTREEYTARLASLGSKAKVDTSREIKFGSRRFAVTPGDPIE